MKIKKLQIPKPCPQSWIEMKEVEGGKFCNQCQHKVIDFSTFTDSQIVNYFKNTREIPCGNFHADQLERKFKTQNHFFLSRRIASAFIGIATAFGITGGTKTNEKFQKSRLEHNINENRFPQVHLTSKIISGIVLNGELHQPILGAKVSIVGFDGFVITNEMGEFSITVTGAMENKGLTLKIEASGFAPFSKDLNGNQFDSKIIAEIYRNEFKLIFHGVVMDGLTNQPVNHAEIKLQNSNGSVFTDSNGKFFIDIPAEKMDDQNFITIEKNGFDFLTHDILNSSGMTPSEFIIFPENFRPMLRGKMVVD